MSNARVAVAVVAVLLEAAQLLFRRSQLLQGLSATAKGEERGKTARS
jgi:hypothetical protein